MSLDTSALFLAFVLLGLGIDMPQSAGSTDATCPEGALGVAESIVRTEPLHQMLYVIAANGTERGPLKAGDCLNPGDTLNIPPGVRSAELFDGVRFFTVMRSAHPHQVASGVSATVEGALRFFHRFMAASAITSPPPMPSSTGIRGALADGSKIRETIKPVPVLDLLPEQS